MNKKGLSTIIITLILILLSIVAIGIVWVVVANVLERGGEQTSSALGGLFLNLKIENVKVESNGDIKITVKRNQGEGEITGINFIVSDGENSQVIKKDEPISELATKTFTIQSSELTDVAFVKEISVAPVFESGGKEQIGNVVDKFEKNKIGLNDLKDYGIISWWRMEGNAQDEIGSNHGTLQGDVNFVDGKFGKAGSFDGIDDYINVADDNSLDITNEITISTWVKAETSSDIQVIIEKRTSGIADTNYALDIRLSGTPYFAFYNSGWRTIETSTDIKNNWHHIVVTYNKQDIKIYIDGVNKNTMSETMPMISNNGPLLFGHILGYPSSPYWFNGQIDEVMIFNKALTDEQIKALYEMDLS